MNNENVDPEQNPQETIFTENDFALHGYDEHIRQARNTLFVLAVLQLAVDVYVHNSPRAQRF